MQNLKDTIDNFSKKEQDELKLITKRVKNAGSVDMVILYGSFARGEQVSGLDGKTSDYDILVITSVRNEKSLKRMRFLLGELFNDIDRRVSCTVETFEKLATNFKENYYFYADIRRDGIVLYQNNNVELPNPEDLTPLRHLEISKKYFSSWFEACQMNLEAALLFINKAQESLQPNFNKKAAFELQQCVENCYKTMELVIKHYAPKEHHLENLRTRLKNIASDIYTFFPITNEVQEKDFKFLDEAYIRARYDADYLVTKDQLDYWMGEAKKLMDYTEQLCTKHLDYLKQEIN